MKGDEKRSAESKIDERRRERVKNRGGTTRGEQEPKRKMKEKNVKMKEQIN